MTEEEIENIRKGLVEELLEVFHNENFDILAGINLRSFPLPAPCHNDGYGDQEDKVPDLIAHDPATKSYIVGIVRPNKESLDSEESLTEYNVFLDQKDPDTGTPYRLYINVPASLVNDLSALIHHYIHREYWYRVVVVTSRKY
jgi:hypothetical protein